MMVGGYGLKWVGPDGEDGVVHVVREKQWRYEFGHEDTKDTINTYDIFCGNGRPSRCTS
jgi:hypothetical protein